MLFDKTSSHMVTVEAADMTMHDTSLLTKVNAGVLRMGGAFAPLQP